MKMLSLLVAASLLSVVAGSGKNLTGNEGGISPDLNNTVNYTLGEGTMLKREYYIFDASGIAVSSYLEQMHQGHLLPVRYLSRRLTPSEQRWPVCEREALAAAWSFNKLSRYLLDGSICGRRWSFLDRPKRGEININEYDYTPDNDSIDATELDKILGGRYAQYAEYPWQTSILYENEHVCSGAIIHRNWVLTVASCLKPRTQLSSFIVRTAPYGLRKWDFGVERFYIHENYDANTSDYDIGLIKIKAPGKGLYFYTLVQPVCLARSDETPRVGTELTVSAWGLTREGGSLAVSLKRTILPVLYNDVCENLLNYPITSRQICVGYHNGNTELCEGDFGGPAVARVAQSFVLFGLVSYGQGCAPPVLPTMLTSVPYFRYWIETTIYQNSVGGERYLPYRSYKKFE